MSVTKTVGILGGMGPRASAHFLGLFIQKMNERGAHEDRDFPRIISLSLPISEFGVTGAKNKESVADQVSGGVEWLTTAGADIVAIPCNSVHEFYGQYGGPSIMNIIDET